MTDETERRADLSRLAQLRRLFHHILNGGRTRPWDDDHLGAPATLRNVAKAIRELEHKTR